MYDTRPFLDWDGRMKLQIKTYIFVGYPVALALEIMQTCGCLARFYTIVNIFFPLGKMIGMMESFILLNRSWENGSSLCRWLVSTCIGYTLTHSYIMRRDYPPPCEHNVHVF